MSQGANQISAIPPLPGATLVSAANAALAALLTQYSGTVAPSSPSLQQAWIDTSGGTIWLLKVWDGTSWIFEGVYDTTNHQFYSPVGGGTATLASNATVDLGSVNQSQITITGTNTITSFGSSAMPGQIKFIKFTGSATITYNATSLVVPGATNITTAAGDSAWCIYQGSGNWVIAPYIKTDGTSLVGGGGGSSGSVAARFGGFDVWQRLFNGATTISVAASTTAYVNDGCYLLTGANQACTVTQIAGIATGSRFAAKLQRNNGQTGTTVILYGIPLFADEIALLRGSNITVSFTAKDGANQSFSHAAGINVYCGTGAPAKRQSGPYTGESTAISTGFTTSSSATRFVFTSAGVIPANCTQMEIQFSFTPTGTAGADDSISFDDLNIDIGTSASTFPRWSFTQQLNEARAVFRLLAGAQATTRLYPALIESTSILSVGGPLAPPMKSAPTASFVGTASNIKLNDLAVNQDFAGTFGTNFSSPTAYGFQMNATAATLTQGKVGFVNFVGTGGEALFLSSEL